MSEISVKSRIALSVAESMLRESGYQIFKPEYEKVVEDLIKSKKIEKSFEKYIKDIANHKNDFLIVGFDKRPKFVKLLYNETANNEVDTVVISSIEPFVRVHSDSIKIPLHVLIKYRDLVRMQLR
ncbi:hypothetical protein J4468_00355 [Candidatus Woesearchaeota archaeon]|nr:hypothetical protein [Candidatus Woesearchaeota archaeon]